jgi:hypothetical protein
VRFTKIFSFLNKSIFIYICTPVNILRIFTFSLVLGHSNFNNTLFQWFCGFFGTPCIWQIGKAMYAWKKWRHAWFVIKYTFFIYYFYDQKRRLLNLSSLYNGWIACAVYMFTLHHIVFRDMVWKLSKLQSGYNELCVYVQPYLTPCTSFVLGLLIFK